MHLFLLTTLTVGLVTAMANAQIMSDGDMDDLDAGTPPNCDEAAGAWAWPANYFDIAACEASPEQFQIVATSSFDAGARGNSLQLNLTDDPDGLNLHLPNLFNEIIFESDDIVTVAFDIWVPNDGAWGGFVYVGGDHGGGGFSNATDRGPQLGWDAAGVIIYADTTGNIIPIGDGYPFDAWQSLRLDINLQNDDFDLWWGLRGDELELLGEDLPYRAPTLDFLDRFSYAHFAIDDTSHSYIDNIVVEIAPACPWDLDGFGDVGTNDLILLLGSWGNPYGTADLIALLGAWGECP